MQVPPPPAEAIRVSAVDQRGMQELLGAMASLLVPRLPEPGAAIPFRPRHVELLHRLLSNEEKLPSNRE